MLDDETGINLWNHVHEIWINPEIESRRQSGTLPKDFSLYAAQILSYTDGRDTEIRLNAEVRATLLAVASKTLQPNEKFILEDGISDIKKIELSAEDDPNAGHLTILKFKGKWILVFDFRYNKKMAKDRVTAAEQFYESAKLNHQNNLTRPLAENLFAAIELLATAQLLLHADSNYTKNQHHTGTINRYSAFIDIGNYKVEYKETLLEKMRRDARYLEKDFNFNEDRIRKYLKVIEDMFELTNKLLV